MLFRGVIAQTRIGGAARKALSRLRLAHDMTLYLAGIRMKVLGASTKYKSRYGTSSSLFRCCAHLPRIIINTSTLARRKQTWPHLASARGCASFARLFARHLVSVLASALASRNISALRFRVIALSHLCRHAGSAALAHQHRNDVAHIMPQRLRSASSLHLACLKLAAVPWRHLGTAAASLSALRAVLRLLLPRRDAAWRAPRNASRKNK